MIEFHMPVPDDLHRGAGILAFCITTGRVLLGYRLENKYSSIGGYAQYGEKYREAAVREFQEETNYSGPILLLRGYHHQSPIKNFEYVNFIGLIPDEFEPIMDETHTEMKWASISELYGGKLELKSEFEDFILESKPIIDELLCAFGLLNP